MLMWWIKVYHAYSDASMGCKTHESPIDEYFFFPVGHFQSGFIFLCVCTLPEKEGRENKHTLADGASIAQVDVFQVICV